jgi:hypothetical protein
MTNKTFIKDILKAGNVASQSFTIVNSPVKTRTKRLKHKWTVKEGRLVTSNTLEEFYYETVEMSKDITRFYARDTLFIWPSSSPNYMQIVKKWLYNKLTKDGSYTILREGSNYYDVISTEKLKEINEK